MLDLSSPVQSEGTWINLTMDPKRRGSPTRYCPFSSANLNRQRVVKSKVFSSKSFVVHLFDSINVSEWGDGEKEGEKQVTILLPHMWNSLFPFGNRFRQRSSAKITKPSLFLIIAVHKLGYTPVRGNNVSLTYLLCHKLQVWALRATQAIQPDPTKSSEGFLPGNAMEGSTPCAFRIQ